MVSPGVAFNSIATANGFAPPEYRLSQVLDYTPMDDGLEPTDFDVYYDIPARTAKDVALGLSPIERGPK